jgi:hypothetical protein
MKALRFFGFASNLASKSSSVMAVWTSVLPIQVYSWMSSLCELLGSRFDPVAAVAAAEAMISSSCFSRGLNGLSLLSEMVRESAEFVEASLFSEFLVEDARRFARAALD